MKISKKRIVKSISTNAFAVLVSILSSCSIADLRTVDIKNNTHSQEEIEFAQDLLTQTVKKHGFDKIKGHLKMK